MKHKVETPPKLHGTAEQQLGALYSYLFRLSENLNVILKEMEENKIPSMLQADGLQMVRVKGSLVVEENIVINGKTLAEYVRSIIGE